MPCLHLRGFRPGLGREAVDLRRVQRRKVVADGFGGASYTMTAPVGQEACMPVVDRDGDCVMAGVFDSLALVSPIYRWGATNLQVGCSSWGVRLAPIYRWVAAALV